MGKVSRADWAASAPWDGITGKPAKFGVTDISELTAKGYANGQVPTAFNGKLIPGTPTPVPGPAPAPVPGPSGFTNQWVDWDPPSLHALQSASEDFTVLNAVVGQPVIVAPPVDVGFVNIFGYVPAANLVRIVIQNLGLADVDIGDGVWRVSVLT